jgi:hypothetical protein
MPYINRQHCSKTKCLDKYSDQREEETGKYKKLHNELHNLYAPPNIQVTKSSRVTRVGVLLMWQD